MLVIMRTLNRKTEKLDQKNVLSAEIPIDGDRSREVKNLLRCEFFCLSFCEGLDRFQTHRIFYVGSARYASK